MSLALALVSTLPTGVAAQAADVAAANDVRASYAAPIRGTDGHVDSPATVARLQELNANTYAFLVYGQRDWDDLRLEFAPAAQAAGLKVWVYLVPPTECPGGTSCSGYAPYYKDYAAWARGIATLSTQYPVVTAWAIDDFNANTGFFTPTYTGQIRQAGRSIQPSLDFYPVVYYNAITSTFVTNYGSVIDDLIMPYNDAPYRNTQWTAALRGQLDQAAARLAVKSRRVILMVYASKLSVTTVPPDVEYVQTLTAIGMEYTRAGTIAGVIQYSLPLVAGRPQNGDFPVSHGTGSSALVFTIEADRDTSAGHYAAASTTIRLNTGSTSCQMVLWHTDSRSTAYPLGYHLKQAYVGGTLVWQRDVASEGIDWYTSSPLDLTPRLSNGSATLTLRLYENAAVTNYAVTARFDDISLTGCHVANPDFESTGGWTYSRNGGNVLGSRHTYDPVYSTTVFAAVSQLYAA